MTFMHLPIALIKPWSLICHCAGKDQSTAKQDYITKVAELQEKYGN